MIYGPQGSFYHTVMCNRVMRIRIRNILSYNLIVLSCVTATINVAGCTTQGAAALDAADAYFSCGSFDKNNEAYIECQKSIWEGNEVSSEKTMNH